MRTLLLAVLLVVVSCADGAGEPDEPCDSPLDCDLGQACRDGECVDNAPAGEGEGEGEGEPTPDALIQQVCQRGSDCTGDITAQECSQQIRSQNEQMVNIGSGVCFAALDAETRFLQCLLNAPCDAFFDPEAFCPEAREFQELVNACFGSGEGEGEGEDPPPPPP